MKLVKDTTNHCVMIMSDDGMRLLQVVHDDEVIDAKEAMKSQKYASKAAKMDSESLLKNYTEMVAVMVMQKEGGYPDFELMMTAVTEELFKRLSI